MTRPSADRVKVVWTGTGTGTMSLGGAADASVQAFPSSLDGQIIRYMIKHENNIEAESGYGLYTHAGATLSRIFRTAPTVGLGGGVAFSSGNKFVSPTASSVDLVVDEATTDPTATSDINNGFLKGHLRINTVTQTTWICLVHTAGAAVWSRLDGAGITLDQNDIIARIVAGSGHGAPVAAGDLTEHLTPGAGDMVLLWAAGGPLRKSNLGNLATTADAAPTLVPGSGTFPLASTARLHQNIIVTSSATNTIFQVPAAAAANSEWRIMPRHTGCTVTVAAGTISPTTARIINGGLVIVTVVSNAGSSPVVEVRGEVIVPSTNVTTKTYSNDDNGQDFTATGSQTFPAVATLQNGFYVNIWNTGAGAISIIGADATHTLPVHGACTVKKRGDNALVCNGSSATSPNTLLDAP